MRLICPKHRLKIFQTFFDRISLAGSLQATFSAQGGRLCLKRASVWRSFLSWLARWERFPRHVVRLCSSVVEHVLGKDEVEGSIPSTSSMCPRILQFFPEPQTRTNTQDNGQRSIPEEQAARQHRHDWPR